MTITQTKRVICETQTKVPRYISTTSPLPNLQQKRLTEMSRQSENGARMFATVQPLVPTDSLSSQFGRAVFIQKSFANQRP